MAAVVASVGAAASVYECHLKHEEYVCQAFTAVIAFAANVASAAVAVAAAGEASIITAAEREVFAAAASGYCYCLASCCLPW